MFFFQNLTAELFLFESPDDSYFPKSGGSTFLKTVGSHFSEICRNKITAYSKIPYYENPFFSRMWEMHNIAVPNAISYAQTSFLQLKVNVYNLMLAQEPGNETIHAKLVSAQKELEDYHRDSMLAD